MKHATKNTDLIALREATQGVKLTRNRLWATRMENKPDYLARLIV